MATLRMSLAETVDQPCQSWTVNRRKCPFGTGITIRDVENVIASEGSWVRLEAFIARRRIEVHIEGIARQADRDRIVCGQVNRSKTRRIYCLDRYFVWFDPQVVFPDFLHHIVADVVVRLLKIGAVHH